MSRQSVLNIKIQPNIHLLTAFQAVCTPWALGTFSEPPYSPVTCYKPGPLLLGIITKFHAI